MGFVVEPAVALAEINEHVGPDGLNNVNAVELGLKLGLNPPPDHHAQVGFEMDKKLLGGVDVARVQAVDQSLKWQVNG